MRPFRRGNRAAYPGSQQGGGVATLDRPSEPTSRGSRRRYDPAWDDWNAPRRWPGVLLSTLVVLGFLSVVIWHYRPHSTAPHHHQSPPPPKSKFRPLPFVVGGGTHDLIRTFHGTRDATGLSFISTGNLLVLHATCLCTYNFDVTILQGFDQPIQFPISATGAFHQSINVTVPAGHYSMSVVSTGPWTLQLIQPQASLPTLGVPFQYYSDANSVLGPFAASDRRLFLQFLGGTYGAIEVAEVNAHGIDVAIPFNWKRSLEATRLLRNPASPYFLVITSTGLWNIEVRR